MYKMFFLLLFFTILAAGCALADNGFLIGDWCANTDFTQENLSKISSGHFNVVMIDAKSTEANLKALDLCQSNGLKGIVTDPRIQLMRSDDDGFDANFDSIIKDYASHPALWGYFVSDKPNSTSFIKLGDVNRYLQDKDTAHTSLANLLPVYASPEQTGKSNYEYYVDEYCRMILPKILNFENYALLKDSEDPQFFQNLEIIRRQGIKHKVPFSYAPQCFLQADHRDPSVNDIRWQVNMALAYGARGIEYFKDFVPADPAQNLQNVLFNSKGRPTRKYAGITKINSELNNLALVLMHLNTAAVYHTASVPEGSKELPKDGLISRIDGGEFVVGQFVSDDNSKYAMFVNKSTEKGAKATIYFSHKVDIYVIEPSTGKEHKIRIIKHNKQTIWNTTFAPGQGRLVRIEQLDKNPIENWEDKLVFRPRIMLNPSNQFNNIIKGENGEILYNEGMNMYLVAERIQKYLQQDGRVDVFITRSSQTQDTNLREETAYTRSLNCDILLALHSDATGTAAPGGGDWTFYWDADGKRLAENVNKNLIPAIKTFYPEVLEKGVQLHWIRLWVIHEAGCPAALTEFLFHSNPKEREFLKDPKCQDIMAKSVADAILEYFGLK